MDAPDLITSSYKIGEKEFIFQADLNYLQLEWIDVVMERLTTSPLPLSLERERESNKVSGSFTREEIERTLTTILVEKNEGLSFSHADFLKTKESFSVKIIADFFLMKAVLGSIINSYSMNSENVNKNYMQNMTL